MSAAIDFSSGPTVKTPASLNNYAKTTQFLDSNRQFGAEKFLVL